MEGLWVVLLLLFLLVPPLALIVFLVRLSERIGALERELRSMRTPARPAAASPAVPVAPPVPGAPAPPTAAARPALVTPPAPPPPPPTPVPARPVPAPSWTSEQVVGGTWLQNVGSVLVLLGVFFLFLWGYSTGRFGPGVLVVAGVAFGALLVWRGDRTVPALPAFGHAVIGIGLGVAYLALYSGHFVLRVFGIAPAIAFLAVAAVTSIAVGMRYRVQLISVLGVIGAFIPWIAGVFTGSLPPTGSAGALLAYLLAVDAICFFLAARAGWSGLVLTATTLTTITWALTQWSPGWSLPVQAGLCILYLGLGLSLVPRILAGHATSRSVDLLAVGVAPWAFAIASGPFLSDADSGVTATILLAMAAAYGACAVLVDERRPKRDLWSQFVVAASAFVAAGIERALGVTLTPLAWCVQGLTLVALGLAPRSGALRFSGYLLLTLGATMGLSKLLSDFIGLQFDDLGSQSNWPIVTANSIRTILSIGTLLVAARLLERHRVTLIDGERDAMPSLVLAGAHASLALWLAVHAERVARSMSPGGLASELHNLLTLSLIAACWAIQGVPLVLRAIDGSKGSRFTGYGLVLAAGVAFFIATMILGGVGHARANHPAVHAAAVILLLAVVPVLVLLDRGERARLRLGGEVAFLKLITAAALVAGLTWSAAEASVLARAILLAGGDRFTLGAALASAAWTAEAIVVFTIGWFRDSSYLRWLGIGTLGLTILKFLLVDLARVDAFWRFLTAIAVGCVLLGLSYVYQRARRSATRDTTAVAPEAANAYASARPRKDDA